MGLLASNPKLQNSKSLLHIADMTEKPPAAQQYEKTLEGVREQFRIAASFSPGNRAAWLKEVEHLLNLAKADLEN